MINKRLKAGITNLQSFLPPGSSPDELLGELFREVQLRQIHPDGKTFVDMVSERKMRQIVRAYQIARQQPGFDLKKFVDQHFQKYLFRGGEESYEAKEQRSAGEHLDYLWNVLGRSNYRTRGSLMPLPYPYIVPGGRFLEQFYWDSYFIMLGLVQSDRIDMVDDMMKNYAYMIRKIGFIPTANRTYFTTRSHPPFFSHMVRLLAENRGKRVYIQYLPYLLAEYRYWMRGKKDLNGEDQAVRRVVRMPDGSILNRYFDAKTTPRPESYREDVETAQRSGRDPGLVYLNLRAGAESGWDYSSRWFTDPMDIATIHTIDIIPVDLNCLLHHLEVTIAYTYRLLKQPVLAKRFEKRANDRARAIRTYCWSEDQGFYFDYDFVEGQRTPSQHLAAAFPLFCKIASDDEAKRVAEKLEKGFLKPGGFATTFINSRQQWDAPNGWAPLQWVAYKGLKNYNHHALANEQKKRWINAVMAVYESKAKFVEKYNVDDPVNMAGGGEYTLQDGFGWTNGVFLAMQADDE